MRKTLKVFQVLVTTIILTGLITAVFSPETVQAGGTITICTEAELTNKLAGGGLIDFNCGANPVTITVTSEKAITANTVIDGGGKVTISGGGTTRVFRVKNQASLTVKNLTIANGFTNESGAAIRGEWRSPISLINSKFINNVTTGTQEGNSGATYVHEATLLVHKSEFTGNKGADGGAIKNLLSDLIITDSTFTNNQSIGDGGAIAIDGAKGGWKNWPGGQIVISGSTFTGNSGYFQGGALFSFIYGNDSTTIDKTTFSGNTVSTNSQGIGMGAAVWHENGKLTVTNSTINDNAATGQGGGFWIGSNSPTVIANSTIARNRAVGTNGKDGLGGGLLLNSSSPINLTNTTVAANYAGFMGGAIWGGGNNVTLRNTLIGNNTADNNGNTWNIKISCGAVQNNGGGNLQWPPKNPNDSSDFNCVSGAVILQDPKLATLAHNGGVTQTIALNASSPAIDAGNGACTAPPINNKDQRAASRQVGASCDIGAYEVGGVIPTLPSTVNSSVTLLPAPVRIADTIGATPNPKLLAAGLAPQNPPNSSSVAIQAGGTNGIPANATGIIGVLTNVQCSSGGNLRFWAGSVVPESINLNIPTANSNLNLSTGFTAPLGSDGKVNLGLGSGAGVSCGYAVDITGYLSPSGGSAVNLLPATVRVANTLDNSRPKLTATAPNPSNPPDAGSASIQIGGTNGIPANATGVMGVLTNVGCTGGGNFRFWAGSNVPTSINLNVPGANFGLNLSTSFTVPLDANGKVNLGLGSGASISCGYAVDITGYLSPSGSSGNFSILPGGTVRIATTLDNSRPKLAAIGATPANPPDIAAYPPYPPPPGNTGSIAIAASGLSGVPADAKGIVGVLTNVGCSGGGNMRFWVGTNIPNSNNLNIPAANFNLNLSTSFVAPLNAVTNRVNLGFGSGAGQQCGFAVDVVGYIR